MARTVQKGHRRAEVWAGGPPTPATEDMARGPSLLGGELRTWLKLRTVGMRRFLVASLPPTHLPTACQSSQG